MTSLLALSMLLAATPLPVFGADATTVAALRERFDAARYAVTAGAADPAAPAGLNDLRAGVRAYDGLLFEEAAPLLSRAKVALAGQTLDPAGWRAYYDALLYLSLTHAAAGQAEEADRALDELAAYTADASVADERFPPPLRDQVAKRVARRPVKSGAIRVETEPAGATVYLNGRRAGQAPLVIRGVHEAVHTVTVELPGHGGETRKVPVRAGFGIGAEATPELVAVTLAPSAAAAAKAVLASLARGEAPKNVTPGSPPAIYFVRAPGKLLVGAAVPGRGWVTADVAPESLAFAPRRDALVREIAGWFAPQAPPVVAEERTAAGATRWWLWGGVGAVVLGGATAAVIAAASEPEPARRSGGVVLGW